MHPNKSRLKLFFIGAGCLYMAAIITSCEKQSLDFGSDFIENNITNLVLVDSLTVDLSTVYVDSFVTSNSSTILAGKYRDEQFGSIGAASFLQLGLPAAGSYTIAAGSVFDSAEVILKLNKTYYGDTLTPYNIAVHQLTLPVTYPSNQTAFYNVNTRDYNSTELGSTQLTIRPATTDTIAIKLSPAIGLDLFNKLQTNAPEIQSNDQFIPYFKGLAITGGNNNNLVLGFKDSLIMRLHYRKPEVIVQNATVDFTINEANYQFNHITVDRTGTPIAALSSLNREIAATQTQHQSFDQYISGAMVKIRFPYLRGLYQLPDFIKIIKAELVVAPVQNSFSGFYTLPSALYLTAADQYNQITSYLTQTGTDGTLSLDNLYGATTAYTFDVTTYLQAQIITDYDDRNGLILSPLSPAATFSRAILGDSKLAGSKTQLKIYYASVK